MECNQDNCNQRDQFDQVSDQYCIKAIQELCEKEGMRYSKPIYKDPYTYLEKKTFIAKMPSQKYLESEPYEREPIILPKRRE